MVDPRVVREPGQDRPPARAHVRATPAPPAARAEPVMPRQKRAAAAASSAAYRSRRGASAGGRGDELAGDAQPERRARRGDEHHERLAARAPVGEQQLVAAHALDRRPGRRIDAEARRRGSGVRRRCPAGTATTTPCPSRVQRAGTASAPSSPFSATWCDTQEAARRPGEHARREPQLVPVDRRPAAHLEQQVRVTVEPARAARASSRRPRARRGAASRRRARRRAAGRASGTGPR